MHFDADESEDLATSKDQTVQSAQPQPAAPAPAEAPKTHTETNGEGILPQDQGTHVQ